MGDAGELLGELQYQAVIDESRGGERGFVSQLQIGSENEKLALRAQLPVVRKNSIVALGVARCRNYGIIAAR